MYTMLYLVPDRLLSGNTTLSAQKQNLRSYFEEVVLPILEGDVSLGEIPLFEKILTGLVNLEVRDYRSPPERIGLKWYEFMKRTFASMGPRIGNFTEYLIGLWIGADHINYQLDKFLEERFGVRIPNKKRSQIDFIRVSDGSLDLIELRTSEHTGGRTSQESLTDKFVRFLELLEDEETMLREALLNNGIQRANLLIVTLFNESGELLSESNYSRGRYSSLVRYLSERRHLGGKIEELLRKGYRLKIGENEISGSLGDIESLLKDSLLRRETIFLEREGLTIEIGVLFGNEFFQRFTGREMRELLEGDLVRGAGDDLWMSLVVVLNELQLKESTGTSTIEDMREYLRAHPEFLRELWRYRENSRSVEEFLNNLEGLTTRIVSGLVQDFNRRRRRLHLPGTDDFVAQYSYLIAALLIALAIEVSNGRGSS